MSTAHEIPVEAPAREGAPIALTPAAIAKVKDLIAKQPEGVTFYLRVGVKPGGCSGMTYDLSLDSTMHDDDLAHDFDGVIVVTDPESAELLHGARLEFYDDLGRAGFEVVNPNATRTCGCGSSFC